MRVAQMLRSNKFRFAISLLILPIFSGESNTPSSPFPLMPKSRVEETIVSYRGSSPNDYLAFPAIVSTGESEILLSYKRGRAHAKDPGAVLEIARMDLVAGRFIQEPIQLSLPNEIMQMGEWVRFPNGTLATYIDAQIVDADGSHIRTGLVRALSGDNGASFGPLERVGSIEGVEYGYLFDTATLGNRLYALIMTFEYLDAGRRSVDALYTDDNGESWRFVRNLSREFGNIRINESSLMPYKDGFIVATRGYDNTQRLHRVDRDFKLIRSTNITEETPTISSYIGRPRLFSYREDPYLIGRNWRAPDRAIPMELALIRFDPESLTVETHFVLDNANQGKVTDGYYPCPLIVNTRDDAILNVFDYRALLGSSPDIIRFQFDLSEFTTQ